MGTSQSLVGGPVNRLFSGRLVGSLPADALIHAVSFIQDTDNVRGVTLSSTGIAARVTHLQDRSTVVEVTAQRDEAGLPILLPFAPGARYLVTVQTKYIAGDPGRVAVVANGMTTVATQALSATPGWKTTQLEFTPPAEARDLYLYVYIPGSDGAKGSSTLVRGVTSFATAVVPDRTIEARVEDTSFPTAAVPFLVFQPSPTRYLPSLINAPRNIQNTSNVEHLSLAQAGIDAQLVSAQGSQAVLVTARRDEAALPIELPLTKQTRYTVSFATRHFSGPAARAMVLANGSTQLASRQLPSSPNWQYSTLEFTSPADARDLLLYLYVKGSPDMSAASIKDIAVDVQPLAPDVVIEAGEACQVATPPCRVPVVAGGQWVAAFQGKDGLWELPTRQAHTVMPADALGYGTIWFVQQDPYTAGAPLYLPDVKFRQAIRGLIALGLVLALWFALSTIWRFVHLSDPEWRRRMAKSRWPGRPDFQSHGHLTEHEAPTTHSTPEHGWSSEPPTN
jgi:hypothetical protein